ncbi:DUF84 family protein [Siminovitchia sediminis]|uniref:inosine/xanthosine triphosphatase n=1 Tax=Siminovitchia sediminis TaxID=1274353 RepID=A0ABW4KEY1_9BACI
MIVAIGSKNKAKIKAVEQTFLDVKIEASLLSVDSPSGVSEQPFSDEETMKGAANRAEHCLTQVHEAGLAIGLEGGVTETPFGLYLCNWGAIAERGRETLFAGGARIRLPDEIAHRLKAGEELGPVMDDYMNAREIRHTEGAVGVLTNGLVDRAAMFSHIAKLLIGQYMRRKGCSL